MLSHGLSYVDEQSRENTNGGVSKNQKNMHAEKNNVGYDNKIFQEDCADTNQHGSNAHQEDLSGGNQDKTELVYKSYLCYIGQYLCVLFFCILKTDQSSRDHDTELSELLQFHTALMVESPEHATLGLMIFQFMFLASFLITYLLMMSQSQSKHLDNSTENKTEATIAMIMNPTMSDTNWAPV